MLKKFLKNCQIHAIVKIKSPLKPFFFSFDDVKFKIKQCLIIKFYAIKETAYKKLQ